jgi:pimeloyl-ACP methyl ester carboxylesterase
MNFRMLALLLGISLSTTLAFAQDTIQSPAHRAATRLPLTPCKFDWIDEELLCGALEVYENRSAQSGRKITINVVVVPSLTDNPTETPLFYFEGGPGVSSTDAASFFVDVVPYRKNRDIVLVDMRGTGQSNPLHCNLVGDSLNLQNYVNEMYPDSAVISCRRSLELIADLTQYTTPIAIEDFEDVRRWLGYETINVMGLSYGTRLALAYMRTYPEHIRSAVLIGPLPPSVRVPSLHAPAGQRAMDLMITDCEGDSACQRAFPNLRRDLGTLHEELSAAAAVATITHPVSGKDVTLKIRGDVFFESLRSKMYSAGGARSLPWIITRAARGDFGPFLESVIPETFDEPSFFAEGLYLSVTCAEDIPYIDTAAARQGFHGTVFGDYRVSQQTRAATHWPRGSLPAGYLDPFTSEVPTLIVSGYRDPVTPPSFAEELKQSLPNGRVLSVPAMAHVPFSMTNPECLFNLIDRFLDIGNADSIDASCIETMQPPPFRLTN